MVHVGLRFELGLLLGDDPFEHAYAFCGALSLRRHRDRQKDGGNECEDEGNTGPQSRPGTRDTIEGF